MSKANPDEGLGSAARRILKEYENCLDARMEYLSTADSGVDDAIIDILHRRLNAAVKQYYEVLYYELSTKDSVEEYWENKTLWTDTRPKTDENGNMLLDNETNQLVIEKYEVQGLKQLEDMFDRTELVQKEVSDVFGTRNVTEKKHKPLPVPVLFRVARLLDQAADDLGLLAEIKSSVHRTKITDDLIEEVEKWRAENLE